MKAELRQLHSPDAPHLEDFVPPNPEDFGMLVEASIGATDEEGEDLFGFIVCTPAWLARQVAQSGYLMVRNHLVVNRYDLELIRGAIQDLCSDATGSDWNSVAKYLARFGKWEFEDYREFSG
jgi:hypothetical protein